MKTLIPLGKYQSFLVLMNQDKHAKVPEKQISREEQGGTKEKRDDFPESKGPVRVEERHCGSRSYSL